MAPRTEEREKKREEERNKMLIHLRDSGLIGVVPKNPQHTVHYELDGDVTVLRAGVSQPSGTTAWRREVAVACRLTTEDLEELLALLMDGRSRMLKVRSETSTGPKPPRVGPPKAGDDIYVRTSMYIDHGQDDVVGGLARVTEVKPSKMNGGDLEIRVEEHPGRGYFWSSLEKEQETLKKEFGESRAYEDPDDM